VPVAPPLELVRRDADGGVRVVQLDRGEALLKMRPLPMPATLTETDGGWVLAAEDRSAYLRLSSAEARLWQAIDGRASVEAIVTAFFVREGSLDVGRVLRLLRTLREAGLIEVEPAGFLRRRAGAALAALEWRWLGAHAAAAALHRVVGGMFAMWCLPIWASLVALGAVAWSTDGRAASLPEPAWWIAVVFFVAMQGALHEAAHAVAVVHAGRRVRHLGVGIGGIYVDTTDLFCGTRTQHATAALAGPAANLVACALLAVAAAAAPIEGAAWLRVGAQAGAALALFTGWPFLLDNDGYHALGDLSGEPHLRRTSAAAVLAGKANGPQLLWFVGSALTLAAMAVGAWRLWAG
jgi:hypothetical protein